MPKPKQGAYNDRSTKAGFVPKYDRKLSALGVDLGCWQFQGRSRHSHQECRIGLFGAFSFLDML